MVIHLNEHFFEKAIFQRDFYAFLRNIMLAYKEGKHLIILDIRSVKKLITDPNVDEITKKYFNHYFSHNKGAINALSYFRVAIQIIPENESEEKTFDLINKIEIRKVQYVKFLDSVAIQKTVLLGENGNDAKVHALFAEFYIISKTNNKFNTAFLRRTGGGSTTHHEYQEIYAKDENICLCILDSDKRTKKKGYGQTALDVAKFHNIQHPPNLKCDYIILPVLEIENLFPENFYIKHYKSKYPSEIFPSIKRMEAFDKSVRKYFDFKKGIKEFSVQKDSNVILYWWELLFKAKINCKNIDGTNYYYVKGFGENILTDFLSYKPTEIFQMVNADPIMKNVWLRLGAYISSYIIASPIERAI